MKRKISQILQSDIKQKQSDSIIEPLLKKRKIMDQINTNVQVDTSMYDKSIHLYRSKLKNEEMRKKEYVEAHFYDNLLNGKTPYLLLCDDPSDDKNFNGEKLKVSTLTFKFDFETYFNDALLQNEDVEEYTINNVSLVKGGDYKIFEKGVSLKYDEEFRKILKLDDKHNDENEINIQDIVEYLQILDSEESLKTDEYMMDDGKGYSVEGSFHREYYLIEKK
jgi:hypothetical protein